MNKICCFGELLLRVSPSLNQEWIKQNAMQVYVGGAELNVAQALASWDCSTKYVSCIPPNYLSEEIVATLRSKNIDTASIHFSGNRLGLYFLPQGSDLKNADVIYDRENSSFSQLKPGMINWKQALQGCSWFHFSAISPALNESVAMATAEAVAAAASLGLTISVDLNYRQKLWRYGKLPTEVMPALLPHCDVVMGNIWSADQLLGIRADPRIHDEPSKKKYLEHARNTSLEIMKRFPKCSLVANTFRFTANMGINYYASIDTKEKQAVSQEFSTDKVIDKVGSGDCFMGGLIFGLSNKEDLAKTINFAAAAAFGKLNEKGDATSQSVEDVKQTLRTHGKATIDQ